MKLDHEAKLPPCHLWVYPSGTMTDDPETIIRKSHSPPASRRRREAGEEVWLRRYYLDHQSSLHRDKSSFGGRIFDCIIWLSGIAPPGQVRWWPQNFIHGYCALACFFKLSNYTQKRDSENGINPMFLSFITPLV